MLKKMKWVLIVLSALVIIYLVGPAPAKPIYNAELPKVPNYQQLDQYIAVEEQQHHLKLNNQARIIWADSFPNQKEYAIVYLHGFSASQQEGDPVHRNIARMFNANLYLSRLSQHGIDTTEQLINLTADNYWESAKRALAIGKKLGKKVILMGTSTGGTQALQLAAMYPNDVYALILYSPNIAIKDDNSRLLNDPWGLQIARLVKGGNYHDPADTTQAYKAYWNKPYRLEAVVALEQMLETSMTQDLFEKIRQPVLMLYYYKDEQHQDEVVKVSAMQQMFNELSTSASQKKAYAIPEAGDHVIASPIKSKDWKSVQEKTIEFMQTVLGMRKSQN